MARKTSIRSDPSRPAGAICHHRQDTTTTTLLFSASIVRLPAAESDRPAISAWPKLRGSLVQSLPRPAQRPQAFRQACQSSHHPRDETADWIPTAKTSAGPRQSEAGVRVSSLSSQVAWLRELSCLHSRAAAREPLVLLTLLLLWGIFPGAWNACLSIMLLAMTCWPLATLESDMARKIPLYKFPFYSTSPLLFPSLQPHAQSMRRDVCTCLGALWMSKPSAVPSTTVGQASALGR